MSLNALTRACAFAAVLALASTAEAHHAAGVGNAGTSGPVDTISANTLGKGVWVADLSVEETRYDALSDATLEGAAVRAAMAGEEESHVHSLDTIRTTSFSVSYGLTDSLMLTARLPYIERRGVREGHAEETGTGVFSGETHRHGDANGWGDLSVLAQWRFLNSVPGKTQAALLLGVEAPTGETRVRDRDGALFDAEFQPGSESWDTYLGMAASRSLGRFNLDASALYTFQGDGLDANTGDRLVYGVAVSWRAIGTEPHVHPSGEHHTHGPALDLVMELAGEWHGEQEEAGRTDPNSSGNVLYASPGVRYSNTRFFGFASVGVPVVSSFDGLQAEPDVRWSLGAGLRF